MLTRLVALDASTPTAGAEKDVVENSRASLFVPVVDTMKTLLPPPAPTVVVEAAIACCCWRDARRPAIDTWERPGSTMPLLRAAGKTAPVEAGAGEGDTVPPVAAAVASGGVIARGALVVGVSALAPNPTVI
jgi:hypothetical protein